MYNEANENRTLLPKNCPRSVIKKFKINFKTMSIVIVQFTARKITCIKNSYEVASKSAH